MSVMGSSPDYVAILDPEDLNTTFLWYWKDVNSIELEPSSSSDFYLVLSADAAYAYKPPLSFLATPITRTPFHPLVILELESCACVALTSTKRR